MTDDCCTGLGTRSGVRGRGANRLFMARSDAAFSITGGGGLDGVVRKVIDPMADLFSCALFGFRETC